MEGLDKFFENWQPIHYWLTAVLVVLYLVSCARVALAARARGRWAVGWFFITLFFTAIPAAIMFHLDAARAKREGRDPAGEDAATLSCPHCERDIARSELGKGLPLRCPHCGQAVTRETLR